MKELNLFETDKASIVDGRELSDVVINASQALLKSQFSISGFQSTLLGEGGAEGSIKFKALPRGKSIQILNAGI